MSKYRSKPIFVDAFKWTADRNQTEDPKWLVEAIKDGTISFNNAGTKCVTMEIKTHYGIRVARRGDYIIQRINGEIYPCKPNIFEIGYDKVPN